MGQKPPDGPAILAAGISSEMSRVARSGLRVALAQSDGGFVLAPRSKSLLGSIWLQFAQALADALTVRRCQTCGTWIEIGLGARPKNRRYCSPKCKLRWFRGRGRRPPAAAV